MSSRGSKGSRARDDAAPVVREGEMPIVALRDGDLIAVTGGFFASATANILKTLGEGISAVARKG